MCRNEIFAHFGFHISVKFNSVRQSIEDTEKNTTKMHAILLIQYEHLSRATEKRNSQLFSVLCERAPYLRTKLFHGFFRFVLVWFSFAFAAIALPAKQLKIHFRKMSANEFNNFHSNAAAE